MFWSIVHSVLLNEIQDLSLMFLSFKEFELYWGAVFYNSKNLNCIGSLFFF